MEPSDYAGLGDEPAPTARDMPELLASIRIAVWALVWIALAAGGAVAWFIWQWVKGAYGY